MIKTRVRFLNQLPGRVAFLEMPKGMKCKAGRYRAVALQDRVVCPGCTFACTLPPEIEGGQEFIVRKEGEA
jgi:hypothetical protein